jgi:hypothetical protein
MPFTPVVQANDTMEGSSQLETAIGTKHPPLKQCDQAPSTWTFPLTPLVSNVSLKAIDLRQRDNN